MMNSYTFKQSVTFTEHNFQSRIGDLCIYHTDTQHLVTYREDALAAQFPVRQIALDSMEEKGWLVRTQAPELEKKVEIDEVVVPVTEEVFDQTIKDEDTQEVLESGSTEELVENDTDDSVDNDEEETEVEEGSAEDKPKRRGGRPKKK
jgi:hypothetical protein